MSNPKGGTSFIGPGLLVAAAGIGAGDMIIGIQLGLDFSVLFIITVLIAAVLKYVMTEGIARYQLASGSRVVNAWSDRFPRSIFYLFFIFFIMWSIMVSAALMSACGLAGNALFPALSVGTWGVLHGLVACLIVYFGKYPLIENITKWLIGVMFLIVLVAAVYLAFNSTQAQTGYQVHYQRSTLLLAILGGVGGSVTMLSYGYWLDEKGWTFRSKMALVRKDLIFSYGVTALFVLSIMLIASRLNLDGNEFTGSALVLGLSSLLGELAGPWMDILFRLCFWGVVFSSMITVWSGVPYLFSDFMDSRRTHSRALQVSTTGKKYRLYLVFLTVAPMIITLALDAIRNVVNYTLISAVFVIGLAITLLELNNRRELLGQLTNDRVTNVILLLAVIAFSLIGLYSII